MQRYEIKWVLVPLKPTWQGGNSDRENSFWVPESTTETDTAWQKAKDLATEGWELIAVVPRVAGHEWWSTTVGTGAGSSYTCGYDLFFRRPKT